ncbi:MAG: glycosyltransferase family 2 protein [Cyclobacteriaceae bacterium]
MNKDGEKKIGVISMARNDHFFIPKWIQYYGAQFGHQNLFLVLDGQDQSLPEHHEQINVITVPHRKLGRAQGDRNRAKMVSSFAKALFYRYDLIIAHDIDEFLVLDPLQGRSLSNYLSRPISTSSLSALGLDVGQHRELELPIDLSRPFLEQRSFAHVSSRYTKPVVATRALQWGSGFHRIKGKNFHIDPNLYLFHFGMVDFDRSIDKTKDSSRLKEGWSGHLDRRNQLFKLIMENKALEGDDFFAAARRRENLYRPLYALNKPGTLSEKPIVKIPARFKSIL